MELPNVAASMFSTTNIKVNQMISLTNIQLNMER